MPISADLENGFGRDPETVAETIRLGAASGLVGGSIEDATGDPDHPIFDMALAADRIRAASETARQLPFRFMLTGRTDNYLHGRSDLADAIRRLQAYRKPAPTSFWPRACRPPRPFVRLSPPWTVRSMC